MLWRPHFIKVKGYWRVFYRREVLGRDLGPDGRVRCYPAEEVPFRQRKTITPPAIDYVTKLNAKLHQRLKP